MVDLHWFENLHLKSRESYCLFIETVSVSVAYRCIATKYRFLNLLRIRCSRIWPRKLESWCQETIYIWHRTLTAPLGFSLVFKQVIDENLIHKVFTYFWHHPYKLAVFGHNLWRRSQIYELGYRDLNIFISYQ